MRHDPETCTHCAAEPLADSDLCEVHHAERAHYGEHATRCICWGCARYYPRPTGIFARYWQTRRTHQALVLSLHRALHAAVDRAELIARRGDGIAAVAA